MTEKAQPSSQAQLHSSLGWLWWQGQKNASAMAQVRGLANLAWSLLPTTHAHPFQEELQGQQKQVRNTKGLSGFASDKQDGEDQQCERKSLLCIRASNGLGSR